MDRGGVYYAQADGSSIIEVAYPLVTPNGIGLSPDGRHALRRRDRGGAALGVRHRRRPAWSRSEPWPSPHGGRLVAGLGGYQRFDSLAVDAAGNICVATLINGGITVISPGRPACRAHPDARPVTTNICFGGPDLRTAYVTLSCTGRLVAVDWPTPGLKLNQAG